MIMNAYFNSTTSHSYLCRNKPFACTLYFNAYEYIHYCTLICNSVNVLFFLTDGISLLMHPLYMHGGGG